MYSCLVTKGSENSLADLLMDPKTPYVFNHGYDVVSTELGRLKVYII